jgi:predicted transposase/invertase (TIGR01784 family)
MVLGIDPRVDFACKLMLGSPDHPTVTIHFLNSVLRLGAPIVGVRILNPLLGKDRADEKVIVLDVLARDSHGRLFNIEMQTRLPLSFPSRLLTTLRMLLRWSLTSYQIYYGKIPTAKP